MRRRGLCVCLCLWGVRGGLIWDAFMVGAWGIDMGWGGSAMRGSRARMVVDRSIYPWHGTNRGLPPCYTPPSAGIDVETGGLFDPLNFSKVWVG